MNSSNLTVNGKLSSDDSVLSINVDLSENQLYLIGSGLLFLLILFIVGCRLYHRRMKKNNTKVKNKPDEPNKPDEII